RLHAGSAVDGAICYIESHRTAIAWGDPLCAPQDARALVEEFTAAMKEQGLRTCWLAVSEDAARLAMGSGHAALKIGEDPVFDLRTWRQPRGDPGKKLRWCVNHARRAGVTVTEYDPRRGRDHMVEAEIADARRTWEAPLARRPV